MQQPPDVGGCPIEKDWGADWGAARSPRVSALQPSRGSYLVQPQPSVARPVWLAFSALKTARQLFRSCVKKQMEKIYLTDTYKEETLKQCYACKMLSVWFAGVAQLGRSSMGVSNEQKAHHVRPSTRHQSLAPMPGTPRTHRSVP